VESFAPVGETSTVYSFSDARDFVLTHFGEFSPELQNFAKRAFDHHWLDSEMRDGKRGGGFCMEVPGVGESRILTNFDGSLDQVSTIAHELGHAFHNDCAIKAGKTEIQKFTPMTLAETASIMCETIVNSAALAQVKNPAEELAILESQLIGDSQVIVDIYSRFLFEKEVFEKRERSELSADEISEIMEKSQLETYGDGLDERSCRSGCGPGSRIIILPGCLSTIILTRLVCSSAPGCMPFTSNAARHSSPITWICSPALVKLPQLTWQPDLALTSAANPSGRTA